VTAVAGPSPLATAVAQPGSGLPVDFGIELDAGTKQLDEVSLFGGSPARVLRLSAAGVTAWAELRSGPVHSGAAGLLARRLTDAGLAHPRPPAVTATPDVTIVIPVRDRLDLLGRCLAALDGRHPVLLVDDGSVDADAVAALARRHAATVLRRERSGGPGVARNAGLAQVDSELLALLDSDCVAPEGWIEQLAAHLADPLVAAVAPRIVAQSSTTVAGRYSAACGSLDLGPRPARVLPSTRVAYVPTAALLVRRSALLEVTLPTGPFDPALRYGEDVDLVWRLHHAGWRVRYDPSTEVRHHEPENWVELLTRRYRYGTSGAPLAVRHPTSMAPLVLQPWPSVALAGALTGRPGVAALGLGGSAVRMARNLRRAGLPARSCGLAAATAVHQTWLGLGRYATQFGAPVLALGLLGRGRWGRRLAVASLVLGPPLTRWAQRRPPLDPVRFCLAHIADDLAYGAGVYAGCARVRTTIPLRPLVPSRSVRPSRPDPCRPDPSRPDLKGST
jgi:mycofactocin system glycosyltransferase